jgi:hypothetical protein
MKTMLLSQVKAVVAAGCIVLAAGTGAWVAADRTTGDERDVCPDLQVRTIEPFPLEYVARSSLPDGSLEFQINSRADGRSYFVKMGEDVNGLMVAGHEEKTEERVIPGLKKPATVDVSGLTLRTGERRIVLRLNQAPSSGEHVASLRSADGVEHRTMVGDVLQAGGEKYQVIGMDPQQGHATVRRESDGREMVVEKAKR